MDYWQKSPFSRDQIVLFSPTLEDRIPADHPVRLLDEILQGCDWTAWEARYHGKRGQPPIHPQVLSSVLLYGLIRRTRSSRQLEYAIGHNIDFMWLVEGRSIDHTTLSEFRRKFQKELKELYRDVCRKALDLGLARLAEVAIDGTRARASNGRNKTLTSSKLEKLLQELDEQIAKALAAIETEDQCDELLLGEGESFDALPAELADLKWRREQLAQMQDQAQEADKAKKREGIDPQKNPAQVPSTDPDSRVLPNKEGGYAPNYTPMLVTDVSGGIILSADVLAGTAEQSVLIPMLQDVQETFGRLPEAVLGDGVYSSGDNLQSTEALGVEQLSPLANESASEDNPAIREDPRQPVAEEDIARLPINPQSKKFDKAAFVYDEQEDRYYCPQGKPLDYEETKAEIRRGTRIVRRVYRSQDCDGCPLLDLCRQANSRRGRTASRDVHEDRRRAHAAKMKTPEAKEKYARRFHAAEVPFAYLKHVMGLRRFLLRGLENVRTEWLWACTAFNLKKIITAMAALRAQEQQQAQGSAS